MAPNWKPLGEGHPLPPLAMPILLWCGLTRQMYVGEVYASELAGEEWPYSVYAYHYTDLSTYTHWSDLPAPPQGQTMARPV